MGFTHDLKGPTFVTGIAESWCACFLGVSTCLVDLLNFHSNFDFDLDVYASRVLVF